ncbi:hypothetical protein JCM5350_001900 [Sporobolomyces pararoseus]
MDYFNSKQTSQLDDQDLLDTIPSATHPRPQQSRKREEEEEMDRVTEALNYLSPTDSPARSKRVVVGSGGYFGKHHTTVSYGSSTTSSSSLSTPSLESDYSSSSLSNSCSPLSTPLDYSDEYSTSRDPDGEEDSTNQPLSPSKVPTSLNFGIASRRKIHLPKLEIPPFQLDASYFTSTSKQPPTRTKPSSFQFDVSPPRRSKTAYSTSLPTTTNPASRSTTTTNNKFTTSASWNPEPIDLVGIIGERPGSPTIKFRQKRRDHGFAF